MKVKTFSSHFNYAKVMAKESDNSINGDYDANKYPLKWQTFLRDTKSNSPFDSN